MHVRGGFTHVTQGRCLEGEEIGGVQGQLSATVVIFIRWSAVVVKAIVCEQGSRVALTTVCLSVEQLQPFLGYFAERRFVPSDIAVDRCLVRDQRLQ